MTKATKGGKKKDRPKGCPVCTGPVEDNGFCMRGGGYPLSMVCPFMCPFCFQGLSWNGGCMWCHGTHTTDDRSTWTFPGDEYRMDKGHWVKHAWPQNALTSEQNIACKEIVKLVLDGKLSELAGQERIQGILHHEVPF